MLNQLRTVAVSAWSPDESLWAGMSAATGLEATVERLGHHGDASLATQLREAMSTVLDQFRAACEAVEAEYLDEYGDVADILPTAGRDALGGYLTEVADLVVVGRSPSGATRIKRRGDDHLDVRIRPGTVAALSPRAMQAEIDAAIAAAGRQYASEQERLYRDWFPTGRIG